MPRAVLANTLGMVMRLVPAGAGIVGSAVSEGKRSPTDLERCTATVARDFWIAETPTTQEQYWIVTGARPSYFGEQPEGSGDSPVESVTWWDATHFCLLLSGLRGEQRAGRRYRLPHEVEWEHACRAGSTATFNVGDDLTPAAANFDGTFPYIDGPPDVYLGRTSPVRTYPPNALGLFDMHGNVWEWCLNRYCRGGPVPSSRAPRVLRGGSWHSYARFCRSSAREAGEPDVRYFDQGFRVVCPAS